MMHSYNPANKTFCSLKEVSGLNITDNLINTYDCYRGTDILTTIIGKMSIKKIHKILDFFSKVGSGWSSFKFWTFGQILRLHGNIFSLLNNFCVVVNDDCSESPVVSEVLHVVQLYLTTRHSQMMERSCNIS